MTAPGWPCRRSQEGTGLKEDHARARTGARSPEVQRERRWWSRPSSLSAPALQQAKKRRGRDRRGRQQCRQQSPAPSPGPLAPEEAAAVRPVQDSSFHADILRCARQFGPPCSWEQNSGNPKPSLPYPLIDIGPQRRWWPMIATSPRRAGGESMSRPIAGCRSVGPSGRMHTLQHGLHRRAQPFAIL